MRRVVVMLMLALLAGAAVPAGAGELVALSLRQAETLLRAGGPAGSDARRLDGITRVLAGVVDERGGDLIVVGEREAQQPGLALDDLVVALRSRLRHHQWPLVSIDRADDTARTGQQRVRFEGGPVERTGFGKALLDADVTLKKLALDLVSAEIWGVPSYFTLCVRAAADGSLEEQVASRFWFRPQDTSQVVVREGVVVIEQLRLGVHAEVLSVNGQAPAAGARDTLADRFAATLGERIVDASAYFPEIARLNRIFELVALARGLELQRGLPNLDYWLARHPVATVDTPATHALLRRSQSVATPAGPRSLEVDGGIELRAAAIRLREGDVTALRELVLRARPAGPRLSWPLPVEVARARDALLALRADPAAIARLQVPGRERDAGTSVTRRIAPVPSGGGAEAMRPPAAPLPAPPAPRPLEPAWRTGDRLSAVGAAPKVGGVMLSGAAAVTGAVTAVPDLSAAGFGLIVEGEAARLAPEAFRRFVTALWAVYFSTEAPGVSIDPIAPGIDRHRVRYIGQVVNTDLGRVMREADYLMKKAAVGTEALQVPGFQDVDELSQRHGTPALGASRRFWFRPQDLRFRRAGDALLFDSGRMVLDTEFTTPGLKGLSSRADQAFAGFFSSHYETIGRRYPVFEELFEYAKLVGLANFLKERRLPLLWFLLANKDQVLTEDSPTTVQALARGSRHRPEITIQGGVDMRSQVEQVLDAGLARALAAPTAAAALREPTRFAADAVQFAALPDEWLSGGANPRGLRFQTDLALHAGPGKPGLELVRSFDPNVAAGEFGAGWRVLLPYGVRADGAQTLAFRAARLPRRMLVDNRLTGRSEVLVFSSTRYTIAGYVPEHPARSEFVGLFPMSDGSFRLADKLGAEFGFDPGGALTTMVLAEDHAWRIGYLSTPLAVPAGQAQRLEAAGAERRRWRNLELPERLRLTRADGTQVLLRFRDQGSLVGYAAEEGGAGGVRFAAVLSDGSFRVDDGEGRRLLFDAGGTLHGVLPDPAQRLVQRIELGAQAVEFDYELDERLRPRVVQARVRAGEGEGALRRTLAYRYDAPGRLARVDGLP